MPKKEAKKAEEVPFVEQEKKEKETSRNYQDSSAKITNIHLITQQLERGLKKKREMLDMFSPYS